MRSKAIPARQGDRAEDQGFKMFLATSEANRMNMMNPPALTPELYERFLPYAIALGVDNNWGKLFAQILSDAVAKGAFDSTIRYHAGPMDMA